MSANVRSTEAFGSSVADSATAVTLLESNAGRAGASLHNDSAVVAYVKLGRSLVVEGSSSVTIKDHDDAATNGVALYVVIDEKRKNYYTGHLEFVSPTAANGSLTVKSGGASLRVMHNPEAALRGTTLHALAASGGLESLMEGTLPVLIAVHEAIGPSAPTGKFLRISNLSSASTAPQLYFDEDASNTYERIQGVIVDNMDETVLAYQFNEAATTSDFTVKMVADAHYELPYNFTGKVSCIWASDGSGSMRITEYS